MVASLFLVGASTASQAVVVLEKVRTRRYFDAVLDLGVALTFSALFAGTLGGSAVAMVASVLFSVYLYFRPVKVNLPEVSERTRTVVGVLTLLTLAVATVVVANLYYATVTAYLVAFLA
jgi:hypothetical protein